MISGLTFHDHYIGCCILCQHSYKSGYSNGRTSIKIHHHKVADGSESDAATNATYGGCYTKPHMVKQAYIAYYPHYSSSVKCEYDGVAGHNRWTCNYCGATTVRGESGGTVTWGSCDKRPYTAYKDVQDGYEADCGAVLAILPSE